LKSSRFENALKIILIYPNLTSVQKYFKPLIFESKILFKIQKKKKEFMLHPPWLLAHLVTRPIFVFPSAPTSGFHWLPPLASIGTAAPLTAPLCCALPTAALLRS
jgi:hypothetical protein